MTYDKYTGAMPDSFFRHLDAVEESKFRQWARDHYSRTLPPGFDLFHPVVRDEWRKLDGECGQ